MRVLILNWRDIRSPRAGGAERLTHVAASGLVAAGHEVTWFTSRPDGCAPEEWIDGVRVVRRGSEASTRLFAPGFARRLEHDVLVEEVNTLPYFAPLWSRVPTLLHINQLAREVWWYEAPLAVAALGYLGEPLYLQAYRRVPVVTISESTRDDLRRRGLRGEVTIVPLAVDTPPIGELPAKGLDGDLLAIGRLVPSKRYDHAIRALAVLRRSHPKATLTVIGSGRERGPLEALADELDVREAVRLLGSVPEADKTARLTEADVLVGCSAREGWGLTVTEAAIRGTPAVVYDIPGFRDAVTDRRTGLLTPQSPSALAAGLRGLLEDRLLYERLRRAAWERASALSWQSTVNAFERALVAAAGA